MRVVEAEAVANCLVSRFSSIRHNHYCTPVVGIADEVNAATSASGCKADLRLNADVGSGLEAGYSVLRVIARSGAIQPLAFPMSLPLSNSEALSVNCKALEETRRLGGHCLYGCEAPPPRIAIVHWYSFWRRSRALHQHASSA